MIDPSTLFALTCLGSAVAAFRAAHRSVACPDQGHALVTMHAPVKQPFAMPGVVPDGHAGATARHVTCPVHEPGSRPAGTHVANGREHWPSSGHGAWE